MNVAYSRVKEQHITFALPVANNLLIKSGFSEYKFEHNALPEINYSDINTSVNFLGRTLGIPLIISSITGGSQRGEKINRYLAEIANDFRLGFAVGSQKIALEDPIFEKHFRVRLYAPDILLFANLGAVQLNYGYSIDECKKAVDMLDADALILHLNPLQEVFQMEGYTNFSGLQKKIEKICKNLEVPVIVKEVGYGISAAVAKKLRDAGVYAVEVAGAGSISWSDIEQKRSNDVVLQAAANAFLEWGNKTTECIRSIASEVCDIKIIASGAVKTGLDIAKSIALGADLCGNASDFLRRIFESRAECENFVESITIGLRTAMLCTGSKDINELKKAKLVKIK